VVNVVTMIEYNIIRECGMCGECGYTDGIHYNKRMWHGWWMWLQWLNTI